MLDPNPERLGLRAILMLLPTRIAPSLGLSAESAEAWESFLRIARPLVYDCGRDDHKPTICLDYGGLDVFAVTFEPLGAEFVPVAIQ